MKVKTSITLSAGLVSTIDRHMAGFKNRSDFIERATRHYLEQLARNERDRRDREILDRRADRLNREAADVLEFQEMP
jgi:metal-responsive CopG/Arc/MetJ family transcriptional regulator